MRGELITIKQPAIKVLPVLMLDHRQRQLSGVRDS